MSRQVQLKNVVNSLKTNLKAKQSEVAAFIGIGETYLSDLLNGRREITDAFLEKANDKAKISSEYINGVPVDMFVEPIEVVVELFKKFKNQLYLDSLKGIDVQETDHKDQLLAALQRENELLRKKNDEFESSSVQLLRLVRGEMAYLKTLYHGLVQHREMTEKGAGSIEADMDKMLAGLLEKGA